MLFYILGIILSFLCFIAAFHVRSNDGDEVTASIIFAIVWPLVWSAIVGMYVADIAKSPAKRTLRR